MIILLYEKDKVLFARYLRKHKYLLNQQQTTIIPFLRKSDGCVKLRNESYITKDILCACTMATAFYRLCPRCVYFVIQLYITNKGTCRNSYLMGRQVLFLIYLYIYIYLHYLSIWLWCTCFIDHCYIITTLICYPSRVCYICGVLCVFYDTRKEWLWI